MENNLITSVSYSANVVIYVTVPALKANSLEVFGTEIYPESETIRLQDLIRFIKDAEKQIREDDPNAEKYRANIKALKESLPPYLEGVIQDIRDGGIESSDLDCLNGCINW